MAISSATFAVPVNADPWIRGAEFDSFYRKIREDDRPVIHPVSRRGDYHLSVHYLVMRNRSHILHIPVHFYDPDDCNVFTERRRRHFLHTHRVNGVNITN